MTIDEQKPRAATGVPAPTAGVDAGQGLRRRGWLTAVDVAHRVALAVVGLAIVAELGVIFVDLVRRMTVGRSFVWAPETAQLCLFIIGFIGGAVAYRGGLHVGVEALQNRLRANARANVKILVEWSVAAWGVVQAVLGLQYLMSERHLTSTFLRLSEAWFILPIVVGGLLLVIYALERLAAFPRRRVLTTGTGFAALVGSVLVLRAVAPHLFTDLGVVAWITVIVFVGLLVIGVPIAFAMAVPAVCYVYLSDLAPLAIVPTTLLSGVDGFLLLAIPFFIWAGLLATTTGMSRTLTDLVLAFLGRVRGGVHMALIVAMYIFSGVSGSKSADVSAIGSVMSGTTRRAGYKDEETASVLSASAIMGETIPPSVGMLVLASYTSMSVTHLFVGGLLPAALLAVMLIGLVYLRAPRVQVNREKLEFPRRSIWLVLRAVPVLLLPAILVVGLVGGLGTPTEVSSFAVVYGLLALLVMSFVRLRPPTRQGGDPSGPARPEGTEPAPHTGGLAYLRTSLATAQQTGNWTGMILYIVGTAALFSWAISAVGLPQAIAANVGPLQDSPVLFMLAAIAAFIFVGAVLEGIPALLLMTPILLPMALEAGVPELQFAMVLLFSMGLAAFTPPLGAGAFVTAVVTEANIDRFTRTFTPAYSAVLVAGLLLVAYIPQITTWLPSLLAGG